MRAFCAPIELWATLVLSHPLVLRPPLLVRAMRRKRPCRRARTHPEPTMGKSRPPQGRNKVIPPPPMGDDDIYPQPPTRCWPRGGSHPSTSIGARRRV
jgi:hypothetical protein